MAAASYGASELVRRKADNSDRRAKRASVLNVRHGSISVLAFGAESGRWPPGRKAGAVDVSRGWKADLSRAILLACQKPDEQQKKWRVTCETSSMARVATGTGTIS